MCFLCPITDVVQMLLRRKEKIAQICHTSQCMTVSLGLSREWSTGLRASMKSTRYIWITRLMIPSIGWFASWILQSNYFSVIHVCRSSSVWTRAPSVLVICLTSYWHFLVRLTCVSYDGSCLWHYISIDASSVYVLYPVRECSSYWVRLQLTKNSPSLTQLRHRSYERYVCVIVILESHRCGMLGSRSPADVYFTIVYGGRSCCGSRDLCSPPCCKTNSCLCSSSQGKKTSFKFVLRLSFFKSSI